jgi:hypothetical protein
MLDTTNATIRRVKTPVGEGMLDAIDPSTGEYQVRISRKDAKPPIQSPCIFKQFKAEELDELPGHS